MKEEMLGTEIDTIIFYFFLVKDLMLVVWTSCNHSGVCGLEKDRLLLLVSK